MIILYLPGGIIALPIIICVDSEPVWRTAWGLFAVAQWFFIGRYFDVRRGLCASRGLSRPLPSWFNQISFVTTMLVGAFIAGMGIAAELGGHRSFWAIAQDAGFLFWGLLFVVAALRRRSQLSAREPTSLLRLS
jgi:hypothetical protein